MLTKVHRRDGARPGTACSLAAGGGTAGRPPSPKCAAAPHTMTQQQARAQSVNMGEWRPPPCRDWRPYCHGGCSDCNASRNEKGAAPCCLQGVNVSMSSLAQGGDYCSKFISMMMCVMADVSGLFCGVCKNTSSLTCAVGHSDLHANACFFAHKCLLLVYHVNTSSVHRESCNAARFNSIFEFRTLRALSLHVRLQAPSAGIC